MEKTAQFRRISLRLSGKRANLRLQADPQDAPLPQSLFTGIQSQGKKAGFAVNRGGSPPKASSGGGVTGGMRRFTGVFRRFPLAVAVPVG
jgi:hypothetical protein